MLGILFIYFIGRYFYRLAESHSKNKWLYAVLGVGSYYLATFLVGAAIGIFYMDYDTIPISDLTMTLIGLPLGLLLCWLYYQFLANRWSKATTTYQDGDVIYLDDNIEQL